MRVSIMTSSEWSPETPNGPRSCAVGFKANKLRLPQNPPCGSGATFHSGILSRSGPTRDSLAHAGPQPGSPEVGHRAGLRCPPGPPHRRRGRRAGQRGEAGRGRAGGGVQCGGCPAEGSWSPATAAGSAAERSGLGGAAGGNQPVGHPLHHHPAHHQPAHHHPVHRPPCPSPTLPSEGVRESQAEILGGIASSAQTPTAKHFQMSPPDPPRAERGDHHLTVGWQRSPTADHIPPWEMPMCHFQTTPRILKTKRA